MTGDINVAIDQLAQRLGTTADRILDVLPSYAHMQAFDSTMWGIVGIVVGLILATLAILAWRKIGRDDYLLYDGDDWHGLAAVILTIVSASFLVCSIHSFVQAYEWTTWPDAMAAHEIVSAIGNSD